MAEKIIPADSAKWLIRQVKNMGYPVETLLKDTGLTMAWMTIPETKISASQYLQIVCNALDATKDSALAFTISKKQNINYYGPWGYAMMSCETLGQANQILIKFWELNGSLVNLRFRQIEEVCIWEITPAFEIRQERLLVFAIEECLTTVIAGIRFLIDNNVIINEIHTSFSRPGYIGLYQKYFGCPVIFNSTMNIVKVPASFLNQQILTANSQIQEMCLTQCEEMLSQLRNREQLVDEIRHLIISSVDRFPSLEEVAGNLGLSSRTLHRRLKKIGTSYQKIFDKVRADLSMEYLKKTNLSIDQISELIGFSETTTFRQAFKKWTGKSPTEFLKK